MNERAPRNRTVPARERGFVLLSVILTITLLAAIAFVLGKQGTNEVIVAAGELEHDRLRYVAEAGLAHARFRLAQNTTCSGYTDIAATSFAGDSYRATISPNQNSPVTVAATAKLSSGIDYSLASDAIPIYQAPASATFRLGETAGKDAMLDDFYSARNYGGADYLQVNSTSSWNQRPLIQFDLTAIPTTATIVSARLELLHISTDVPGVVSIHRVDRDWLEGTKSGGGTADGATWPTYDGASTWTTPGGDFDPDSVAAAPVTGSTHGLRATWEIAPLVSDWVAAKSPNFGLLMKGDGAVEKAKFASQDTSNPDDAPRLIVTYSCECGVICAGVGGNPKKILFVVGNAGGLTTEETAHQNLIESWGYTVETIDDDATKAQFDTAAANNDVAFTTNDITASRLDTKLVDATIGVVTSEDNLSDEFGLASAIGWDSGTLVSINDNTHYITSPFSIGSLTILSASESLAYVTGTLAPDLGRLARSASGYGVVTLDAGETMFVGGAAAGRRVQLPWGGTGFDPNNLNADGLTILQRALEWAATPPTITCDPDYTPDNKVAEFSTSAYGSSTPTGLTYLPEGTTFKTATAPAGGAWISVDSSNGLYMTDMSGTLLESCAVGGGSKYGVTLVDSGTWTDHLAISYQLDRQVVFVDLDCNQVASFSTNGVSDPRDIAYIDSTAGGLYADHLALIDLNRDEIQIVNQAGTLQHTIDISGLGGLPTGIEHLPGTDKFVSADSLGRKVYTVDLNGTQLAQYDAGAAYGLVGLEGITFNPLTCDHVITDVANDLVVSLNSGGGGGGSGCAATALDTFSAVSYTGSDADSLWVGGWVEFGDSGSPSTADERVIADTSGFKLQIADNDDGGFGGSGEGVWREVDLSGMSSATLSFKFQRSGLDNANDAGMLFVSGDGGATWSPELWRTEGPGTDTTYQQADIDVSAYIASDTRIRFQTGTGNGVHDKVFFDDVTVCAD